MQEYCTVTQHRIPTLKTVGRDLVVTNQAKVDLIGVHFTCVMATKKSERQSPQLISLCSLSLDNFVVPENVAAQFLRNVNNWKAPRSDSVISLLKHYAGDLSKPLTHILLQCLSSSIWPTKVHGIWQKKKKKRTSQTHPIITRSYYCMLSAKPWSGLFLCSCYSTLRNTASFLHANTISGRDAQPLTCSSSLQRHGGKFAVSTNTPHITINCLRV